MTRSALRGRVRDAKYRHLADPATWNGAPVQVALDTYDKPVGFGDGTETLVTVTIVKVRQSQVSAPATGDIVVINDVTYAVIGEPRAIAAKGEWVCEVQVQP